MPHTQSPFFPLDDVSVRRVKRVRQLSGPLFKNSWMSINKREFAMQVEHVGSFYACDGREVEYAPADGATTASIELYLNGSVYGAILHQRQILPIHGSSFILNGRGIMICGDSGAGKSSITTSFCLNGAEFLTDDVTPITIRDKISHILPFSDRPKLWKHSLEQFSQDTASFSPVSPGEEKYYVPIKRDRVESYPLSYIFMIGVGDDIDEVHFDPLEGASVVTALRDEIYRLEFLNVLPKAEANYFQQLIDVSRSVPAIRVIRPENIPIEKMRNQLEKYLSLHL